jgi:hypothetical protein
VTAPGLTCINDALAAAPYRICRPPKTRYDVKPQELAMFEIFKRPSDVLFVDRNRVFCPVRRADTDVEKCASCHWLLDIDLSAEPNMLRCRPAGAAALDELPFVRFPSARRG